MMAQRDRMALGAVIGMTLAFVFLQDDCIFRPSVAILLGFLFALLGYFWEF